jgi:hypothetical protein
MGRLAHSFTNLSVPTGIKGRQIRKDFDGVWFVGTITTLYPEDKQVKVVYSDGDSEDLDLAEAYIYLTPRNTSEKRPAKHSRKRKR